MHNVLRVWKRDIIRLFKAPAALVVVGALIVLPSLYTWFNVIGFWNPYENTGNLRVCVVNEDAGAESDLMGELDVGSQIVDSLADNDQLGWAFMSRGEAEGEVMSGRAYAMFVIPEDFSRRFTTLLDADGERPTLEYYVNEKNGAVAPKITDTGATTLDETVNAAFISAASEAVAQSVDDALGEYRANVAATNSDALAKLGGAVDEIGEARAALDDLGSHIESARGQAQAARAQLDAAKDGIALAARSIDDASGLASDLQKSLSGFWASTQPTLDEGSSFASQSAAKADRSVTKTANAVAKAQGSVDGVLADGQAALEQARLATSQLEALLATMSPGDPGYSALSAQVADLKSLADKLSASLSSLRAVGSDVTSTATAVSELSTALDEALQAALESGGKFRSTMSGSVVPVLVNSMGQVADLAGGLAATVAGQQALVDQAAAAVGEFDSTLESVSGAITSSDEVLDGMQSNLASVRTDVIALGSSDLFSGVLGEGGLDPEKIAGFMESPTEIVTESPYHLNAYGSAMAPLFTNLTLWIGVFMLLVILKQEVDDEGIRDLTIRQRYAARWLFLAPIAVLQALVCCIGNLVIGVQTVNAPLYCLTAVAISLSFLSLQYALATTMQHVGKGLCIALVFAQIPGATGLYPIEMTPPFFQAVYPVFPFTYGINAMRETIAGMYGTQWLDSVGVLMLFFAVSFVAGLVAIPYLTNLNRLFARQIREGGIMNGEEGRIPERRFRLDFVLQMLSDHEEYREQLRRRAESFFRLYPRLKRGAWVLGIGVPAVATIVFAVQGSAKVVTLTAWLIWIVVVIAFLIVLEYAHNSIERQLSLVNMSGRELRAFYELRDAEAESAQAGPAARGEEPAAAMPAGGESGAEAPVIEPPAPADSTGGPTGGKDGE